MGIVGLAGAVTGLIVGGIGGRLLMRVAAIAAPERATGALTDNGNRVGDITASGTVELLIFAGILFGIIGAIAYVVSEPWLSWAGRARGAAFALFILAIGAPVALVPGNPDFALVGNDGLIVGMFVAIFLLYGLSLPSIAGALERRLPGVNPDRQLLSVVPYLVLIALGTLMLPIFLQLFFIEDACGCEPNYLTGVFVVAMGVATLSLWIVGLLLNARPARLIMLGYGALLGAAATGAFRAWSDIADILDSGL